MFKALYCCFVGNNWSLTHFCVQFISHIPVIGKLIIKNIRNLEYVLPVLEAIKTYNSIENKKFYGDLIAVGGIGGALGYSILESLTNILYMDGDNSSSQGGSSNPQPGNSSNIGNRSNPQSVNSSPRPNSSPQPDDNEARIHTGFLQ